MKPFIFTTVLVFLFISGCSSDKHPEDPYRAPGTIEMAERLQRLANNLNPQVNPFANTIRIEYLKQKRISADPVDSIYHYAELAQELLYAGRTRESIDLLHDIEQRYPQYENSFPENFGSLLINTLAIAYLRLAEEQNCIEHHTAESCIIPIRNGGIHHRREGSENAIRYYTQLLESEPEDYTSRWLLNVAYMTIGKYPDEVPRQWLIPPAAFEPEYEIPRFIDIAGELGVNTTGLSGGAITEDFTGNGYLDILTSSWNLRDQIRFYVNNGDGTFSDKTIEAGLEGITGGLNMVHADYTNNGFPDVLVLRGAWMGRDGRHPNSLLRNNGDGTFTDVTEEAGILSFHPTQTAAWGDFNNNGWVDLFIGNESTDGSINPCELYMNNGDGTFTNIARDVGLNVTGFVKGVVWGDINNNGYIDLYISRLGEPNLLFRNNGPDEIGRYSFTEIGEQAGVEKPLHGFPVWFWDYNNDGYLDIFVSAYKIDYGDVAREYLGLPVTGEYPRLYRNNGDETFTDVTEETRLDRVMYTMGSNFGDLDNDGYLDFYVGTGDPDFRSLMPNRMFRNAEGNYFQEVTTAGGFGHIQKGHGVSFADLNNDGFQDIYMNIGGALEGDIYQNALFKNPGNENNWITLRFEGVTSNRAGIGARVKLVVPADTGRREIHRVVTSGGSFGGSSFQQKIGIGSADRIEYIEIFWLASGTRQVFKEPAINMFYKIIEGDDELHIVDLESFKFATQN